MLYESFTYSAVEREKEREREGGRERKSEREREKNGECLVVSDDQLNP